MADVVGLRGGPIPAPAEPDVDLLAKLESLTERAQSGKIRAMAFVIIDFDESWSTGWAGEGSSTAYLAGVAMLQHRLAKDIDES